jgi:hypothetical protein
VVSVNVGERSKPVVLHLEEPIEMVERLREAQERNAPGAAAVCRRAERLSKQQNLPAPPATQGSCAVV